MSDTQAKLQKAPASGTTSQVDSAFEAPPKKPGQDFAFAVKLFGWAGLVFLLIWLMNRAVS